MIDYKLLCAIDTRIVTHVIYCQGGADGVETREGVFDFGHAYVLLDTQIDKKQETGLLLVKDHNDDEVWVNIQDFEIDPELARRTSPLYLMKTDDIEVFVANSVPEARKHANGRHVARVTNLPEAKMKCLPETDFQLVRAALAAGKLFTITSPSKGDVF